MSSSFHKNLSKNLAFSVTAAVFLVIAIPAYALDKTPELSAGSLEATAQAVDQDELLWWLPSDTESVVAALGLFPLPPPFGSEDERQGSGERNLSQAEIFLEFERLPLELFHGLFNDIELPMPLRGSKVALAMQGSRHFRDPLPGLDAMDFEGCSIVVFENELDEHGEKLVRTLREKASGLEILSGKGVLVFHQKSGDAEWNLYFAAPRANVLLVANNLQYIQDVLQRMTERKGPRAFPNQLPEWRFLGPDVRFWGLRHYDRTQAKYDATSPFSEERTFGSSDEKAIGILFTLDPGKHKKAVITYFSGDEALLRDQLNAGTSSEEAILSGHEIITRDGGKTFEDPEPEKGVKDRVQLRSPTPGVLERVYSLNRTTTLSYFILNMEIALGRGMYF